MWPVSVLIWCRSSCSPIGKRPLFSFCIIRFCTPCFLCDEPSSASECDWSSVNDKNGPTGFAVIVSCRRLRAGVRGALESVVGRALSGTTSFISCRNSCSSSDNFFCFLSTFTHFRISETVLSPYNIMLACVNWNKLP